MKKRVLPFLVLMIFFSACSAQNDEIERLKAENEKLKSKLSTYTNSDNNEPEHTELSNIETTDPEASSSKVIDIIDLLYEFKEWDGKKSPGKTLYTLGLDNETYLLSIFCDYNDTRKIKWLDIHYYKDIDSTYSITLEELEPFEKLALFMLGDNAAESEWKDKILSASFPTEKIIGSWKLKMDYYIYEGEKAGICLAFYNQIETTNLSKSQIANTTDSQRRNYSSGSLKEDKTSAWIFAKNIIKENLKAPSTAKFPWYDEKFITTLDDGRYLVKAYVDAENSFGAKLRKNFSVKIRITGEYTYTYAEMVIN
jgi:hypothetical protein